MEEPRPNNPKDELIAKLTKKNLRMSYSTLKNFTSPINLINYKLKPYRKSPSMVFGSLCDVLLLTPDNFDKEFEIVDNVPTTDKQQDFCDELYNVNKSGGELTEEIIKGIFPNFYSRGDAMKTYEPLKPYLDARIQKKECISSEMYEEAILVTENLMSNQDIQTLFSQITDVQKKIKWTDNGWEFLGFLDMLLTDHIIDLKFSKDANPEKFERDIMNFDYYLQAAMYCKAVQELGICDNPRYSLLVYDKSFNYSFIQLDYSYLAYGKRKYDYLLQELDRCIAEGAFDQSYGFFKRSFVAYKPKWAKAFQLENDPIDV